MKIHEYIKQLIANSDLSGNPRNRTLHFHVYESDIDYWNAREEMARLFHEEICAIFPDQQVDLTHRPDGPGQYYIKVFIY